MLLTIEHFESALGEAFGAIDDDDAPPLILLETTRLPSHPYPGKQREPFSLVFRGESAAGQGLRRLHNATLGDVEIFLVPVSSDAEGTLFEAVFN